MRIRLAVSAPSQTLSCVSVAGVGLYIRAGFHIQVGILGFAIRNRVRLRTCPR